MAAELRRIEQESERTQAAERASQRDHILLLSYGDVHEIELLRDQRIATLEGQLKVNEHYVGSIRGHLLDLEAKAKNYNYPYDPGSSLPQLPDELAQELLVTVNQLSRREQETQRIREEQAEIKAQFDSDIERFRQLKPDATNDSAAAATATPVTRDGRPRRSAAAAGQLEAVMPDDESQATPLARARVPNAACAAASSLQNSSTTSRPRLHDGHEDHLRDALARRDRVGRATAIPARHEDLTLIVRIDEAGEIAEHDAVLVAESRARKDHRGEPGVADVNGDARGNEHRAAGHELDRRIDAGAQIQSRRSRPSHAPATARRDRPAGRGS